MERSQLRRQPREGVGRGQQVVHQGDSGDAGGPRIDGMPVKTLTLLHERLQPVAIKTMPLA
jgi:hypothetical protein